MLDYTTNQLGLLPLSNYPGTREKVVNEWAKQIWSRRKEDGAEKEAHIWYILCMCMLLCVWECVWVGGWVCVGGRVFVTFIWHNMSYIQNSQVHIRSVFILLDTEMYMTQVISRDNHL